MLDSSSPDPKNDFFPALLKLHGLLFKRRRFQLVLVFLLMLAGAAAELTTIAAAIPFLGTISSPTQFASIPLFPAAFRIIGWDNADDMIVPLALFLVGILLMAASMRLLLVWATQKYVFRIGHELAISVFRKALHRPFAYHALNNSSTIISGTKRTQSVALKTLLSLIKAAAGAVTLIAMLGALIVIDAEIALAAIAGFGAMYIAISFLGRNTLESNGREIARAQTGRVRLVQEGLGGIRDVVLNNAQKTYLERFVKADSVFRGTQVSNTVIGTVPRYMTEAITVIAVAILALVLSDKQGGSTAALPLLGAFALAGQRILPSFHNIFQSWTQIKSNQQQLLDVLDLIEISPDLTLRLASVSPHLPFLHDISFSNVSFKYSLEGDMVIDTVNLTIGKGTRVGFVGKTGSGRSTIIDLIMGFLEPVSGEIRIDGELLTRHNIRSWQANIVHVAQDVYLADASLAENIAFGIPFEKTDFDRAHRAALQAAISEVIERLPDGYRTMTGERGIRLSGGQKQRIGIVRTIYKDATIMVLDEATSALDNETESEVMEAIQALSSNMTVLIIAHRPSTVAGCDQIIRAENGKASATKVDAMIADGLLE
jgi:ATP-binding cassette, subfamily B, bacterial PglK